MAAAVALYSAVDEVLTQFDVDVESATLTRRASLTLPAKVQYVWRHPVLPVLYVTTTNGGPRVPSDFNQVQALAIAADGHLSPLGAPQPLPRRAVHLCTDPAGRFLINAHNFGGGGLTVHHIAADGSVGAEVPQAPDLDCGIYPHQVRVFPSGRTALIVDRGNQPQASKPEDPGALRTLTLRDGRLGAGDVLAPNGGYGFGPRHADFHPTRPWLYVSDERFNRLHMLAFADDRLPPALRASCTTLAAPDAVQPRQIAGPIHVHPDGQTVYVANRADGTVEHAGQAVFAGGENNIAVYRIDPDTGVPTLLQHAPTQAFHARTFACDPAGRLLVAASIKALTVRDGDGTRRVPAALSVFRIGPDGCLTFAGKVDIATSGSQLHYWMGLVALP